MIRARTYGWGAFVLLMVFGLGQNVFADSIYTTSGCFIGGTCASTYSSVNFTNVLTGGVDATLLFQDASGNVIPGSMFSLGSFMFALDNPGLSGYVGQFDLTVTFTNPVAAGTLTASVLGGVLINAGGAVITFSQNSQSFGSFTLDLNTNPVYISNWNTPVSLDATIVQNVSAPEGSGLAMLVLSGIVSLGAIKKKAKHLSRMS